MVTETSAVVTYIKRVTQGARQCWLRILPFIVCQPGATPYRRYLMRSRVEDSIYITAWQAKTIACNKIERCLPLPMERGSCQRYCDADARTRYEQYVFGRCRDCRYFEIYRRLKCTRQIAASHYVSWLLP